MRYAKGVGVFLTICMSLVVVGVVGCQSGENTPGPDDPNAAAEASPVGEADLDPSATEASLNAPPDHPCPWCEVEMEEFREGLWMCRECRALLFEARMNRHNLEKGGHWCVTCDTIEADNNKGHLAMFPTDMHPQLVWEALMELGATPGDNVDYQNHCDLETRSEGSRIEVSFSWDGQATWHEINEVIQQDDLGAGPPLPIDIRFSGNNRGTPEETIYNQKGCIVCVYTCPTGVCTNHNFNRYELNIDSGGEPGREVPASSFAWRFTGNFDVLPEGDGIPVRVALRVLD